MLKLCPTTDKPRNWLGLWMLALVACAPPSMAQEPTTSPQPTLVTQEVTALPPTFTPRPTITRTPPPTPTPVGPTPDAKATERTVHVPILMYHYVEPWPVEAGELRQGLTVQPADFAAQMRYLAEQGYVTVSLYDVIRALAVGQPLPPKAVVLTFDDGYRTLMNDAVPTLQQYDYTGTVFVITQFMDEGRSEYLTWEQAEALQAQGWSIEPHTKTHEALAGRDRDFQLYQMLGSIETVAAHTGEYPRFFAYPLGYYDEVSVQLAEDLQLWGAVTTEFGFDHTLASPYTLRRVRVNGRGTLQNFINALGGK